MTDRAYWEKRSSKSTVDMAKEVLLRCENQVGIRLGGNIQDMERYRLRTEV